MDLNEYLGMLVETYNPNKYAKIVERPMHQCVLFLIMTVAIALMLFTIFILPVTYYYATSIPDRTTNVELLTFNAQVNASGQVELLSQPRIVLDLDANGTRTGALTLSRESIIYPKYLFFGTAEVPWSDIRDLKRQTSERDMLVKGIIIFLLPSVLFWFFFISAILCVLLFTILVLLGYFVPRIFKHRITLTESCKVAILSLPSLLLFSLGLYPLGVPAVFFVGIGLSLLAWGIGIAVISELDLPEARHKTHGKV